MRSEELSSDMQEDDHTERKATMSLVAKAPPERVEQLLNLAFKTTSFSWLRAPETGSVMVRGRAGATGAPFNLGEMTVTRCTLQLDSGEVGHGYVQGRRKADAKAAALVDALMQTVHADTVRAKVLEPLAEEIRGAREQRAAKAAATKVDFFTLVRGED